jgi:hypothetical protein
VTVRLLESLLRLSESHAILCCKPEVTVEDAVVAIWCVSLSQQQLATHSSGYGSGSGAGSVLHSKFPANPELFYSENIEPSIFTMLNCSRYSIYITALCPYLHVFLLRVFTVVSAMFSLFSLFSLYYLYYCSHSAGRVFVPTQIPLGLRLQVLSVLVVGSVPRQGLSKASIELRLHVERKTILLLLGRQWHPLLVLGWQV